MENCIKKVIGIMLAITVVLTVFTLPASAATDVKTGQANLFSFVGSVTVSQGGSKTVKAFDGMRLKSGYSLKTGKNSNAYITIDNNKVLKMDQNTHVKLSEIKGNKINISLVSGKIFNDIKGKLPAGAQYTVTTANSVMGVRGTVFSVGVNNIPENQRTTRVSTQVKVFEGNVSMQDTITKIQAQVTQGQQAVIQSTSGQKGEAPTVAPMVDAQISSFEGKALKEVERDIPMLENKDLDVLIKQAQSKEIAMQTQKEQEQAAILNQIKKEIWASFGVGDISIGLPVGMNPDEGKPPTTGGNTGNGGSSGGSRPSSDASLAKIMYGETAIAKFDASMDEYNVMLPVKADIPPQVSAVPANAKAEMIITQATGIPGVAAIEVSAQDGTKQTYKVGFDKESGVVISTIKLSSASYGNQADGSAEVAAVGGKGSYEYAKGEETWQASNQFLGLQAGTYTFRARDKVNTENVSEPMQVTVNQELPKTDTALGGILIGDQAIADFTDGQLVYHKNLPYAADAVAVPKVSAILDATSTATAKIIQATVVPGTATILVTAQDGKTTAEYLVEFTMDAKVALNVTKVKDALQGANDGEIHVAALGGSPEAKYEYRIGSSGNWQESGEFVGLSAGTYQVFARDQSNDDNQANLAVNVLQGESEKSENANLKLITYEYTIKDQQPTVDSITEVNQEKFVVMLKHGLLKSPTVSAEPTADTASVMVSDITEHTGEARIQVTAENGNQKEYIVAFTQQPLVTFTADITPVENTSDGAITITPSGGSNEYEYQLDSGGWGADNTFKNLEEGQYTVAVRDSKDENNNAESIIEVGSERKNSDATLTTLQVDGKTIDGFSANQTNYTFIAPYGVNSIAIEGTATESSATVTGNASYSIPGTANITVTAENGSTKIYCITLKNEPRVSIICSATNVTASGGDDGTITITASGAREYEYFINNQQNGQTSHQFTGLSSGTYTVKARDLNNFTNESLEKSVTISQPVASSDASLSGISQNTTSIQNFDPTKYVYTHELAYGTNAFPTIAGTLPAGSNASISITQASAASPQGKIEVTAQDGVTKKTYIVQFKIPQKVSVSNADVKDATAYDVKDGTITVSATGGKGTYEYSHNSGSNWQESHVFLELGAGQYTIMARDKNQKENVSDQNNTITIKQPNQSTEDISQAQADLNQALKKAVTGSVRFSGIIDIDLATWDVINSFQGNLIGVKVGGVSPKLVLKNTPKNNQGYDEDYFGLLFNRVTSSGSVRDFDVVLNTAYSMSGDSDETQYYGLIAGRNDGLISGVTITLNSGMSHQGEKGTLYMGSVAGYNTGKINGVAASGAIKGTQTDRAGGLVGRNSGAVLFSSFSGEVQGNYAGGIIGYNHGWGYAYTCEAASRQNGVGKNPKTGNTYGRLE